MRRLMLLSGCLCLGACIAQPSGYPGAYGTPYDRRGYATIGTGYYNRDRAGRDDRGRDTRDFSHDERQHAVPARQQREAEPVRAQRPEARPAPRPERPRPSREEDRSSDRR